MGKGSECNRRYNEAVAGAYASYGRTVARHPKKLLGLGLGLAILACIGIINVQASNDVLDIWMYKGTRLDGEKAFYEKYFGGGSRGQSIMVSDGDNVNIATPLGLDAMLQALEPLVPGGNNELTFDINDKTMGMEDLCQSATVPSFFKPYPSTEIYDFAWFAQGAFMSYGYRQVSICAKRGTGDIPQPAEDLEDGWGIDRFPCSRLTPLDCFQEGGYDYPEALKKLDTVSTFVAFNNRTTTGECVAEFGVSLQELLEFNHVDRAAILAAEATTQLTFLIQGFYSWGYHWRTPYTGMTEAEIVNHLKQAREFAFSDDAAGTCIASKVPCCLTWAATKLETDYLFGEVDELDGTIKHFMTNQINFPVNHPVWISRMEEKSIISEEDREKLALGWEDALRDELLPRFNKDIGSRFGKGETYEEVELDFFTKRSGNDIIAQGNNPEAHLIVIAYLGMLIFAALSMGAWEFSNPKAMALYSRVLLSLGGMFVIALSTVACLGFMSAVGAKLTPLSVAVVPFLSLGIGIDDMFIFISTLVHTTSSPRDPSKRLQTTLVHAGPSVTITSIAVAGCFLVASAISIDTVRFFALHMGAQMLFHVILMHLMLLPMMYWDSVRVLNLRSDLFLVKLSSGGLVSEAEFTNNSASKRFVEHIWAPLLRNKFFKAATIIAAAVSTAVLTWYGVTENTLGVGLNSMTVEGSHEASFLKIFESKFTAAPVYLVTKEVDLATYQETLLDMQESVQEVEWVSGVSSVKDNSWLADSFTSFLGPSATPVSADEFSEKFAAWIKGAGITSAYNFYCSNGTDGPRVDCTDFDPATTVIKASQQNLYLKDQATKENNVKMFKSMRKAVDGVDPSRDTFAYSDAFALHSQYLYTWEMFYWVIGGGAVMVTFIITILQGSIVVSLLMALSIVMVVLQVFGLLTFIDVGMNGFSIVNLCVMVGLVVEFTAHIARGFLFSVGDSRDERVEKTLSELLWPTFAGACTTFLAVLPLTFSKIAFFHNYFFETFAIMAALGFMTGVCFLPVMLSIIGPASHTLQKGTWEGQKPRGELSRMHSLSIGPVSAGGSTTRSAI